MRFYLHFGYSFRKDTRMISTVNVNTLNSILVVVAMALATAAPTSEAVAQKNKDPRIEKAKELFERYVTLEQAFDPAIANLYSEDAVIRNKRTSPTGEVRETTITASQYKEKARIAMPFAKARGDVYGYSEITYTIEGDGVRITAQRYSERKKSFSPLSIAVRPNSAGEWWIYEELTESSL